MSEGEGPQVLCINFASVWLPGADSQSGSVEAKRTKLRIHLPLTTGEVVCCWSSTKLTAYFKKNRTLSRSIMEFRASTVYYSNCLRYYPKLLNMWRRRKTQTILKRKSNQRRMTLRCPK